MNKDFLNIKQLKEFYNLDKNNLDSFAQCLAESFKGYPLFEYFACYKYSVKKMKTFWNINLKMFINNTVCYADSKDVKSVVIFSPYDHKDANVFQYLKSGGLKILFTLGIKSAKRMLKFEKFANSIKNKYSTEKCWYLYSLVVRPEFRGNKLGSTMLRSMFDYLDSVNQDCYLETLVPINVEIYKHYGFELMETVKVPDSDLVLYAMLRKARNNNLLLK